MKMNSGINIRRESEYDTLNHFGKKYIMKKMGAKTMREAEITFAKYML